MSTSNLIRWSGLATIIGGVLILISDIAYFLIFGDEVLSVIAGTSAHLIITILFWMAFLLILLGMIGLYARQAERGGVFGLIAFSVAFVGLALGLGAMWTLAFVPPSLVEVAPEFLDAENAPGILDPAMMISFSLAFLGMFLMGLSALQANVLSRWMAAIFSAGIFLSFVVGFLPFQVPIIGNLLFAIATAALGYGLWAQRKAMIAPAQPISVTA